MKFYGVKLKRLTQGTEPKSLTKKRKKSHKAKNNERGPFSLARHCMLRGKEGKTFLILFARPNGSL